MIELLIAIMIALGAHVDSGRTETQLKASNPVEYEQASQIITAGNYRTTETGVVIIESGGD